MVDVWYICIRQDIIGNKQRIFKNYKSEGRNYVQYKNSNNKQPGV